MAEKMTPSSEEMYDKYKKDAKTVDDLEALKDGEFTVNDEYTVNLSEDARKHMGAAVESAKQQLEGNVGKAKVVKDRHLEGLTVQARSEMNDEMAQRNERYVSDEDIIAKARSMFREGGSYKGTANDLIYHAKEYRSYYPGYSDVDMAILGNELLKLIDEKESSS